MIDPDNAAEAPTPVAPVAIHASTLFCEACGRVTAHRILHVSREGALRAGAKPRSLRGIARCRVCGVTHRFETPVAGRSVWVPEILSEGPRSVRRSVELPAGRKLLVGSGVPGSDPPVRIRAIDRRDGRRVSEAVAEEIATLWVERQAPPQVRVSLLEGRRTTTVLLPVPSDASFGVGETIRVGALEVNVRMIRARGETWRRPGDRFPFQEIQRLYARRTAIPPAGRRAWSAERVRPVSRASSTSRSPRSRSSPGVRRRRTEPRARRAD